MSSFSVLDEKLNIHKNYLLEASAGTGKTFAIENIVVRLLIEKNPYLNVPLTIDQILVVTFTNAATSDLKKRIRKNIESYLKILKSPDACMLASSHFISKLIKSGHKEIKSAIRNLESALFCFDRAQIYTIHAFCSKMLKENIFECDINLDSSIEKITTDKTLKLIKNYFRTALDNQIFSKIQIEILLKSLKEDFGRLVEEVRRLITNGLEIDKGETFSSLFQKFQVEFQSLKTRFNISSDKLLNDFEIQRKNFKKLKHECFDEAIDFFIHLFDKENVSKEDFERLIKLGLVWSTFFSPENKKKTGGKPLDKPLFFPDLPCILSETLVPLVDIASSSDYILANVAYYCRSYYKRFTSAEEMVGFDELLCKMEKSLDNPLFIQNIRNKLQAAIIDEFQDTDPLQWKIFKTLFIQNVKTLPFLYLVGDPKQSIYSFRQADIYTYLDAVKKMGEENLATLDTNYRSQNPLIQSLNKLFSGCPDFLTLPKIGGSLEYKPVKGDIHKKPSCIDENTNFLQLCAASIKVTRSNAFPVEKFENQFFLPFIVQEICLLQKKYNLKFSQFAVLVSDRYQEQNVASFLLKANIPSSIQKRPFLLDSPAYCAMVEVLTAVIDPRDESLLKKALGNAIFQFSDKELLQLFEPYNLEDILHKIYFLRAIFLEKGFISFFDAFMNSCWKSDTFSIRETLLVNGEGIEFYEELQQVAEYIMEYQSKSFMTPEELVRYLNELTKEEIENQALMKKRLDPHKDAVTIVTFHSSKGLEYDIVFALGSIKRSREPELIVPVERDGTYFLKPLLSKDSKEYLNYCNELDAEKMRQFYVAMTRAKDRLYIPIAYVSNSNSKGVSVPLTVKRGTASPIELFLAKMQGKVEDESLLYERLNEGLSKDQLKKIIEKDPYITIRDLNIEEIQDLKFEDEQFTSLIVEPQKVEIIAEDSHIQSFTSLSKMIQTKKIPQEHTPPQDYYSLIKTKHTLPAGADTGIILHEILENIPFDAGCIKPFVKESIIGTALEEWGDVVEDIINKVLNISLDGFLIKEIKKEFTYKELQFFYPIDVEFPEIEEIHPKPGFLNGVIDVVFMHEGKYYIIDWKSNWLGSSTDFYNEKSMNESMNSHHYYLQAELYKNALKRYLQIISSEPFENLFGGIYYIFLRGIEMNSSSGIYKLNKEGVLSCLV